MLARLELPLSPARAVNKLSESAENEGNVTSGIFPIIFEKKKKKRHEQGKSLFLHLKIDA